MHPETKHGAEGEEVKRVVSYLLTLINSLSSFKLTECVTIKLNTLEVRLVLSM